MIQMYYTKPNYLTILDELRQRFDELLNNQDNAY